MIALDELKKLSIGERWQIIKELIQSIEEDDPLPDSPEFIAELLRVDAAYRDDPASGVPLEIVKARSLVRCS